METKEAPVKTAEWQPRGHPYFILSDETRREYREWAGLQLPGVNPFTSVEFQVLDPLYHGHIDIVRSKPSAAKPGAPRDSLISYQIYNRHGKEIARVNTRGEGEVTIFDTPLKRKEIAEALEGVKEALEREHATAYTAYGLYRRYQPTEMQRRKIPEEQIVRDEQGNPRRDKSGNTWVISGKIKQRNTQQIIQKSAS